MKKSKSITTKRLDRLNSTPYEAIFLLSIDLIILNLFFGFFDWGNYDTLFE